MPAILTPASTRDALERRSFSELRRSARRLTRALAKLWPALTPLERAACWRLLPAGAVAAAAKALPAAARWEAYLASSVDCVAPYLEDARPRRRGNIFASRRAARPPCCARV